MESGTVYTETTVFSPPERYAADAPYQMAIIELEQGERRTVRIAPGNRVKIGDRLVFSEERNGVAFYRPES